MVNELCLGYEQIKQIIKIASPNLDLRKEITNRDLQIVTYILNQKITGMFFNKKLNILLNKKDGIYPIMAGKTKGKFYIKDNKIYINLTKEINVSRVKIIQISNDTIQIEEV